MYAYTQYCRRTERYYSCCRGIAGGGIAEAEATEAETIPISA